MKKHLVCIKIGGSIVTDKSKPLRLDKTGVTLFVKNMTRIYKEYGNSTDFLLGNGAGSFGHVTAKKYGLKEGASTASQFYGSAATHNNVRKLNLIIGQALNDAQLPVSCLSPGDILATDNGVVCEGSSAPVQNILARDTIPLLHGDILADTSRGISILSTERALLWFAQELRHEYELITVIVITQTGGVLAADGTIIPTLHREDNVEPVGNPVHDVTGSMLSKVSTLRQAVDWVDAAYIINNSCHEISQAIKHEPAGTKVL